MIYRRLLTITAFSLLAIAARCQEDSVITRIEFTSLTRGYNDVVSISPDSLIEITDRRENQQKIFRRALRPEEWKDLVKSTETVSLNDISQLLSPTSKRAFDGARHSTITVHTKDGKTYTHAFDDEHPHEKLQPLMETIKKTSSIGNDG